MANFQLIVKGEAAEYTAGDSVVIDLDATTIEEAREEAKIRVGGDPSMWAGAFERSYGSNPPNFRVYLDPEDEFYGKYDHCVVLGREEKVYSATIVEVHDAVDLGALRDQIREFTVEEKRRKERERDEAELRRLQQKLGATP